MSQRPRLGPAETVLWNKFIDGNKGVFTKFEYDFRLLPSEKIVKKGEERYPHDWDMLTAPRIDVIATKPEGTKTIIEVRPSADFDAIARVETYKILYTLFTEGDLDIKKAIVCYTISKNTRAICNLLDIKVFQVPQEKVTQPSLFKPSQFK